MKAFRASLPPKRNKMKKVGKTWLVIGSPMVVVPTVNIDRLSVQLFNHNVLCKLSRTATQRVRCYRRCMFL